MHTTLQQLLDVSRCKDNPSLSKGLIGRLRREKQTLQLAIRCHSFTTLAVQPALTSIPQLGVARQLTAELSYRSPVSYPPHNRSLPRPIQSALFQVEQHLHSVCLHTLLFLWAKVPVTEAFSAMQSIVYQSNSTRIAESSLTEYSSVSYLLLPLRYHSENGLTIW